MVELRSSRGADPRFDRFSLALERDIAKQAAHEGQARRLVERLVLGLQGALLLKSGNADMADAFCASRLDGDHGGTFGTLPPGIDAGRIARAVLALDAA